MGGFWIAVEKLLGLDEMLSGLALDGVRRGREWRPGETNERRIPELVLEHADGLVHEGRGLPGIEKPHARQILGATNRRGQTGPKFSEHDLEPHGFERD